MTGLDDAEARRRLAAEGPNALPRGEGAGLAMLAWRVATEPMFLLLIGAASVYVVLGDLREALVLAASIVVVLAITVVQERRTERALEALRELSSPRALVVRGGRELRIAGSEVVRGDLLVLREGDRVSADATLLEAHGLSVDESLLTGESLPVAKARGDAACSGTLVVRGVARAEVSATGPRSALGRIGASLGGVDSGRTALQAETARIVRIIAIFAAVLCVAVALLYHATRGDPLAGVLAGLTLAMALLPEEFPVVLTVFLALGAWRISRHGVLTRRMPAIEMLGAATVLCCDKTGTLTENRMAVASAWREGEWRKPAAWHAGEAELLAVAALASEPAPFDPMERAILEAAHGAPGEEAGTLERRYPLAEGFLAVCHAWRRPTGEGLLAMKGAPEAVIAASDLADAEREAARHAVDEAARNGLRVLGVARVRPEQKLRLVNAYRAAGEVVAMTGDGVNDAPALKAAHIGIAMGRRGTDVAREAAALVLLDDDFTSIVGTVRLGRRIHDNIVNAMRYLLAVHVPMAGMSLLPLLFGWPLFAYPVHVVFLEFVIDPACSIVFEAERGDPHVMERPPRAPSQRLFNARAVALALALGASVLAAVAAVYGIALDRGLPADAARAAAFVTMVCGNLALILVNRSPTLTQWESLRHENAALWWVVGAALVALAAVLWLPPVAAVFRFAPVDGLTLAAAAIAGVACVLWYDALKLARR